MRRLQGLGRAFLRSYDKQRVSAVRVCGPKVGAEAACAQQKAVEALDVSFYALKEGGERGVSRRAWANAVYDPADCGSQAMAAIVMWPGAGGGLSRREGGRGFCKGSGEGGIFALFAFRRRREAHCDGGSAEHECRRLSLEPKK